MVYNTGSLVVPTVKQSNVDDFVEQIMGNFEATGARLTELEDKLNKALVLDVGEVARSVSEDQPTDLYRILQSIRDKTDAINRRINDLTNRVRL